MSGGNNGKVLTVSRKLAKILTDSRKSHHPIETLLLLVIIAELAECSRICTTGTPKPRLCIVVESDDPGSSLGRSKALCP